MKPRRPAHSRRGRRLIGEGTSSATWRLLQAHASGLGPHRLVTKPIESNRWHASAPCETWPNRYFAHAGTAGGYVDNERSRFPYRWPRGLSTIFKRLDACGRSWRIDFDDLPQAATLVELWPKIPTRFSFYGAEFAHPRAPPFTPRFGERRRGRRGKSC